jgi:poly(A) polymerase
LKTPVTQSIFDHIRDIADTLNQPTYLIGGYVRDLVMKNPSKDIDIVTVGDGLELATLVAKQLGKQAKVSYFKNFGTAQIKYSAGDGRTWEIEFVGARKESYQRDSRKPIVENGTL